jgi:outer membrane lipoprotein SlyB
MARRLGRAGTVVGLLALAGCAPGEISPSALNEGIGISYGTVQSVTPVKVSPTGEIAGSIAGGLLGLALTAGHSGGSMLLGAAGGALGGGLLGHVMQGSDTADQFVIRRNDGSTFEVATEQRDLVPGDCVAIEQGEHTNLRRVNDTYCQPGTQLSADSRVALEEQHDAQVCYQAKQSLNNAQGTQAIEAAIARVRALCHG